MMPIKVMFWISALFPTLLLADVVPGEAPVGEAPAGQAAEAGHPVFRVAQAQPGSSSGADPSSSDGGAGAPRAIGPARAGVSNPHGPGGVPTVRTEQAPEGGSAAGSSSVTSPPAAAGNPHAGLGLPVPGPALEPGKGIIRGQLIHPQGAQAALAGYEVRLFAFEDNQRLGEWHTESDASGAFRFDALNTRAGLSYISSVMFQGVVYLGSSIQLDASSEQRAEVKVHDSKAAPGALELSNMHVIVQRDPGDGAVQLTEVLAFTNPGQETLIGGDTSTTTLTLDLPRGVTDFQPLQGMIPSQVSTTESALLYTGPFYPGLNQLVFSYRLPPQQSTMFRRRLPVPAGSVDVFVEPSGPSILSPQLARGEPLKLEGTLYDRYSAGTLAAGLGISFQIGGAGVSPDTHSRSSIPADPIAAGVIVLIILFVARPLLMPRPEQARIYQADIDRASELVALMKERDRQMLEVKELDFDFASGKLSPEDHALLRDEAKALAIEALQAIEQLPSHPGAKKAAPVEPTDD